MARPLPERWLLGERCGFSEVAGQEAGSPRRTEQHRSSVHQRGLRLGRGLASGDLPRPLRARFYSDPKMWFGLARNKR